MTFYFWECRQLAIFILWPAMKKHFSYKINMINDDTISVKTS